MAEQIWKIENERLVWQVDRGFVHTDNIEMSGFYVDDIVYYGTREDGTLALGAHRFSPMLRTIPNNTHATFCFTVKNDERIRILKAGEPVSEYPTEFTIDGTLGISCDTDAGFTTHRTLFPATDKRFALELLTLRAKEAVTLSLSLPREHVYAYGRGTKGVYISKLYHNAPDMITLRAGEEISLTLAYTAEIANSPLTPPDGKEALEKRRTRVKELCDGSLVLKTGHTELDTMTRFAKLRAAESIFETLTGKYHSPGGQSYYAATWCNDQVEYAGPHFALTGDATAVEASLNAYRSYIPFMSETFHRLPSSIIAEGLDIWEGAGDRGDAAMYLYGASFFALALGDRKIAEELYPAIRWCAEYCERKKTPDGVIGSDSDELEGRFPTDKKANLSTSSLAFGGLTLAAKLARSLGDEDTARLYTERADALAKAIEAYFGATLHDFDTYRYSQGFDTLRAWICLPLSMGITTRREGTLAAMLSSYLWTEEGMLSCERGEENKSDTIWDRATLYGMKAAFLSGAGEIMQKPLLDYCHRRLVCDHVPYAVEAYPEGGKRHLSGESALFVRVVTEGLLGILPESLESFSFTPRLSSAFSEITLSKIHIAGGVFSITVSPDTWTVTRDGKSIAKGKTDGNRVTVKA